MLDGREEAREKKRRREGEVQNTEPGGWCAVTRCSISYTCVLWIVCDGWLLFAHQHHQSETLTHTAWSDNNAPLHRVLFWHAYAIACILNFHCTLSERMTRSKLLELQPCNASNQNLSLVDQTWSDQNFSLVLCPSVQSFILLEYQSGHVRSEVSSKLCPITNSVQ